MKFKPGIVFGTALQDLYACAKSDGFALPAVNTISNGSINAVLETAKMVNSPVIVQLSQGGAQFYAGKSLNLENYQGAVLGAVSAANHVHLMAEHYGVPVVLHTDHADNDSSKLYTQPEDVDQAYTHLKEIGSNFTIAASFGNVHGVYKPGNVKLSPIILKNSQDFIQRKYKTAPKPVSFVFHGGSGSSEAEIR